MPSLLAAAMSRNQVDRTSSDHMATWRASYAEALRSFKHGATGTEQAVVDLSRLGYRDQALEVEMLEWFNARVRYRQKYGLKA